MRSIRNMAAEAALYAERGISRDGMAESAFAKVLLLPPVWKNEDKMSETLGWNRVDFWFKKKDS